MTPGVTSTSEEKFMATVSELGFWQRMATTQGLIILFFTSALYAVEHGFSIFSSTLGISRWKDMQQINALLA